MASKKVELTNEQIKYYQSGCDGVEVAPSEKIDTDRWMQIADLATSDVQHKLKKRDKSAFKSETEYKVYLLSCYETALEASHGRLYNED